MSSVLAALQMIAAPEAGEPCFRRRHVLTMFGFWACFCMEVSRNFSVVVIPMAKEFGWDHATVGAVFASSYCETHPDSLGCV